MLTIDFEQQEGITVRYPPLLDDIRNNHGFVDLRGRPDLAAKISEGSRSNALKDLLVELSEHGSPFFSVGCDLGSHEEPKNDENARYVAGGYVQLMHRRYADRSPEDYYSIGEILAQSLNEKAQNHNWLIRFVLTFVAFNLDNFSSLTPSLWIWFYAAGHTPQAASVSREVFLSQFREALERDGSSLNRFGIPKSEGF
jgi:hypothetical protein